MELAGIPLWIWGTFLAFVLGMLALDLGVFHRQAHEVKTKEALLWSAFWIALALVFNGGVYLYWDSIYPNSEYTRSEAGIAFLTGYLIEKSLSVDNIFVFLLIFTYFQIPAKYQHRVLFWGIIGALVFRALFIALGSAMLKNFAWTVVFFGLLLIYSGIKMIKMKDKHMDPGNNPVIKWFQSRFKVTSEFDGQKFFTVKDGVRYATPLMLALIFIEMSDIVFAIDSIPAIFAITKDPFIVFTSNVFAILGLRALYFAIGGLVGMFRYLGYGLAAILVFVGGKMLGTYAMHTFFGQPEYKFPIGISLGVIATLLTISILASIIADKKERAAGGNGDQPPTPSTETP